MSSAVALSIANIDRIAWPSERYREDPCGFAEDVLGVTPWIRQREVLEALIPERARVACASGQKTGKSTGAAIAALWFYCSFADARVVLTSTTSRQVDQILWRELRMRVLRAKKPIDGRLAQLARSGLRSDDFREVHGFTAKEPEAVQGISGTNVLYIVDEASGVPDPIFEALEGNRAGGARILLIGNPTRTEGTFFDAFHDSADFYSLHHISSEQTPNVLEGERVIPGLAEREFIEEKRKEWGVDSPLYKVRILGEFVLSEDGKIISLHSIAEAEGRWHDIEAEGRLHLGLDPAGPGDGGDETCIAVRRGRKVTRLYTWRGLSEEAHLAHVLGVISKHSARREPPAIVTVDREGPIGSRVFGLLRAYADNHPHTFEVCGLRSSDAASREPHIYDRARDELWAWLAKWLRGTEEDGSDGGAIPEDTKLARELHAPEWKPNLSGKLKVTPKKDLRKALGRSPDRADAVALAVWEPAVARPREAPATAPSPPTPYERVEPQRGIDPYAGLGWMGRGGARR